MRNSAFFSLAWIAGLVAVAGSAAGAADSKLAPFEEHAKRLEASFAVCEPDLFDSTIAVDLMVQRAARGLEADPDMLDAFARGVRDNASIGVNVCQALEAGGSYKLLRVRMVEGKPRALFRMLVTGGGVDYHDLMLASLPGAGVRTVDFYTYISGEWFSQSLRRGLLTLVAQEKKGILERILSKEENVYVEYSEELQAMAQQAQSGQGPQALATYRKLPPELQRNKSVLLLRMRAAQEVSEAEYRAVLDDIKKTFPDDPAIALTLIDYHFFREEFDTAMALVDQIDEAIGGDPYLNVMRASCRMSQGRLDDAWQAASLAIRQEPDLADAYWTAVTVTLEMKKYEATAKLLTMITERLGVEIGDLTEIPEYSGFVRSPAYRAWLSER